jgi:DNA primase
MIFPKDFPDKLRSTILTSEVVGKKVKLKNKGYEFSGLCPFHNEKTPSFTVNDNKGFYHCFGCQAHGDIISFVMNIDGLTYPEAVIKLANDFGILIPQEKFDQKKEEKVNRDYLILEKITDFFEKNLFLQSGKEAYFYLKSRKITDNFIKKFRLGFALNSYESLYNFLKKESFSDEEILRTGVVGRSERGFYDKFRNRVMFPILDKKGRAIAFGGRTIGDDLPKYLNSSETEFFKKSQTLYNYSFARKAIFSKGYAIVVEGYMDTISLFLNGIENVVAGLGTAFGIDHIKELFYITDKIVICLDGDDAGLGAAKRVSEISLQLINAKKNIFFAFLPNKMDPDDFIKEFGANELEKFLQDAKPLSESLFDFSISALGLINKKKISAEDKARLELDLNHKINQIKDPSSKKYFSIFIKDKLFFLGRNQKNNPLSFAFFPKKNYQKSSKKFSNSLILNVIALLIKFPKLVNFSDEDFMIKEIIFSDDNLTSIKEIIVDIIDLGGDSEEIFESLIESKIDNKIFEELKFCFQSINLEEENIAEIKLKALLLRDLLLQVEEQYKDSLKKIDDITTDRSEVVSHKIREIFDYKNFLQQKILMLESQLS